MIRVGLVGIGGYAHYYLQRLLEFQEAGRIQLEGCVVRSPEKHSEVLTANPDLKLYPDLKVMLESQEFDLVAIPAGIPFHVPMACLALAHGCHVIVEKPVAGSSSEIQRLSDAAKAAGKEVFVGFQHVHGEDALRLKSKLSSSKVEEVRLMGCWPRSINYYQKNDWSGKLIYGEQKVLDSPIHNGFGHHLHLAMWALEAEPVAAHAELIRVTPIQSFDTAFGTAMLSNQVPLRFQVTLACQRRIDPVLRFQTSEGNIDWMSRPEIVDAARRRFFELVISRLEGQSQEWICDPSSASTVTQLAEMLHESSPITDAPDSEVLQRQTAFGDQYSLSGIENRMLDWFAKGA